MEQPELYTHWFRCIFTQKESRSFVNILKSVNKMNSPVADCNDMISKSCCFLRLARIFCNYKKWECCYFEICLLGFNFFDCLLTTGEETPTWHSDIGNFKVIIQNTRVFLVADPRFPSGRQTQECAILLFSNLFPKIARKWKNLDWGRGSSSNCHFLLNPTRRTLTSGWFVHILCIMIVYENLFFKFSQKFLSEVRLKKFS